MFIIIKKKEKKGGNFFKSIHEHVEFIFSHCLLCLYMNVTFYDVIVLTKDWFQKSKFLCIELFFNGTIDFQHIGSNYTCNLL